VERRVGWSDLLLEERPSILPRRGGSARLLRYVEDPALDEKRERAPVGFAGSCRPGLPQAVWRRTAEYKLTPAQREREFLKHIQKNRVDPSFQSFSNPVPDYYGEKIGSVKQYRQWLKDQRAYNKKREAFL
jgi:hypothetical protein